MKKPAKRGARGVKPDVVPIRRTAGGIAIGSPHRLENCGGLEAYTLAMLLAEEAERVRKRFDIKIFATDMAEQSLSLARAGIFPAGIEGDLSNERLDRFFEKEEHTWRIRKEIRERVVFAPQNLLSDPPFSRLDMCTCRNLLIYLEPNMQQRVIALLHFALREGGCFVPGQFRNDRRGG